MSRRARIVLVAALAAAAVAALATGGLGWLGRHASGPLVLGGNVDIRQVDLGFRVGGRIESIPFEEGARVEAGATLAALDTQPLKDQLSIDDALIGLASAQLDRQRNGNRAQDIAQAEARLAELRAQLDKARAGSGAAHAARARAARSARRRMDATTRAQFLAAEAAGAGRRAGPVAAARRARASEDIGAAQAQHARRRSRSARRPSRTSPTQPCTRPTPA
jgi:HlyD family secretion protein